MKKLLFLLILFLPLSGQATFNLHESLENVGVSDRPQHLVVQNLSDIEQMSAAVGGPSEVYYGDQRDLTKFMQKIMNGMTAILAAIAIYFIVLNAFNLVVAFGNSDNISKAKSGLAWSGAGFLLIVFAYVIVKTIMFVSYSGEMLREAKTGTTETAAGPPPAVTPPAAPEMEGNVSQPADINQEEEMGNSGQPDELIVPEEDGNASQPVDLVTPESGGNASQPVGINEGEESGNASQPTETNQGESAGNSGQPTEVSGEEESGNTAPPAEGPEEEAGNISQPDEN